MSTFSHRWDLSPEEAFAVQRTLAAKVERQPRLGPVKRVAGVDVSVRDEVARAAVVVLDFEGLSPVDYAVATRPVTFPYIPGLLGFREGPVVLDALARLSTTPDLLIIDGQGLAHPRRLGIASHVGLLADLPAIGCAKSRLCGRHDEPGQEAGSHTPLLDAGEVIGVALRTRRGTSPVYVSIGHRVDLATSIRYVLACCRGYRLPETTRWAHRVAGGETPPVHSRPRAGAVQPTLFDL
jgi:deoxyribonuclease V